MLHKKIANAKYEEGANRTTRSVSRHGLKPGMRREKRIRNRVAKREEERIVFADQ